MKKRLLEQTNWGVFVALLLLLFGLVNYLAGRHYVRWDLTKNRVHSLSDQTLKVLKNLGTDVRVTVFLSPGDDLYDRVMTLLDAYRQKNPRIRIETVDPDRDRARAQALAQQYKVRVANVVVFEASGHSRHVEKDQMVEYDFGGLSMGAPAKVKAFKAEAAFTNALLEVVDPRRPVVLFTSGHGERSAAGKGEGIAVLKDRLSGEGATVKEWVSLGQADVPEEASAVVAAGPQTPFTADEARVLSRYLEKGGRLLLLLDPILSGRPPAFAPTGLEDLLRRWGIALQNDVVLDPPAAVPQLGPQTFFASNFGDHPVVKDLAQNEFLVLLVLCRSLETGVPPPEGYTAAALLRTSPSAWGVRDLAALERGVGRSPGDAAGPLVLAAAVFPAEKSAKKARLVVVGDSDFASDAFLGQGFGNQLFALNALHWLLEQENRIAIPLREAVETHLDLTATQANVLFVLFALLLPLLSAGAGIYVFLQRRR